MDLDLWRVAVRARDDADSAAALRTRTALDLADAYRTGSLPAVQRAMTEFLGRWGHRAVAEIDLDAAVVGGPAHLFGVLSGYLRLDPDAVTPEQHFADGARDARTMMLTLNRRRSGAAAFVPLPSGSACGALGRWSGCARCRSSSSSRR